jgi:integrase
MSRMRQPFSAWPRHPVTGKQFQVSARTERELQAKLHEIDKFRSEIKLAKQLRPEDEIKPADDVDRHIRRTEHGRVTVERAALAFLKRGDLAENTARRVRSFLASSGKTLAACLVDELDGPRLERWEAKLRAGGTMLKSSIDASWRTLRQIVRFASSQGWIGQAPWGTWRPSTRASGTPRQPREATRDVAELAALLAAAAELDGEREAAALLGDLAAKVGAAALLGLRQGELAGLRWYDLSPSTFQVAIVRQWDKEKPTKTRAAAKTLRALPELFALFEELAERLKARGLYAPRGPVFPMRESEAGEPRHYARGECLSRRDLRSVVHRAALPHPFRWSPHSLRDSFVTLEASTTHDLRAVADRSRHVSIRSLVRYLHRLSREPAPPGFVLPSADAPRARPQLPESSPTK